MKTFSLAILSGRDIEILCQCPSDEIAASNALGVSLVTGATIHAATMTAALSELNVSLPVAVSASLMGSAALFAVDRLTLRATDLRRGEALLRKTEGNCVTHLSSWMAAFAAGTVRLGFSFVTAVSLGGFTGLHFYDTDLRADIALRQAKADAPRILLAEQAFSQQVDQVLAAIDAAEKDGAARAAALGWALSAKDAERVAVTDRISLLDKRIANLVERIDQERATARDQLDLANCENRGVTLDCPKASGVRGAGDLQKIALDRAEVAQTEANALQAELTKADEERTSAVSQLAKLSATTPTALIDATQVEKLRSDLAALQQKRPDIIARTLQIDPQRQVLNPDSLAERLVSLSNLATRPATLLALVATALMTMALESLGFLAALMSRPSEYALRRAAALDRLGREFRNTAADAAVEDADRLAAGDMARRTRADRKEAEEAAASILNFTRHRRAS